MFCIRSCSVIIAVHLLVVGRAEYTNVQHNIITDGSLYYTVYPDPGPSCLPFPFYTPNPGLTNWIRYTPPLFYDPIDPVWSVGNNFANYELNAVEQNLTIYFDVEVTTSGLRAIGVAWGEQIADTKTPWQSFDQPMTWSNTRSYMEPSLVLAPPGAPKQPPILLYRDSAFVLISTYLTNDGMHFASTPTNLLSPSLDWEEGELRHPRGFHKDGLVYIMYLSGNGTVGVARSHDPMGPYEKHVLPVGRVSKQTFKSLSQQQLSWGDDGWPYLDN